MNAGPDVERRISDYLAEQTPDPGPGSSTCPPPSNVHVRHDSGVSALHGGPSR